MKQKLLTIKSLLVAVLLGVGVNGAWGAAGDQTTNVNVTFDGTGTFANSQAISYTKDEAEIYKTLSGTVWKDNSNGIGGAIVDGHLRFSNGNMTIELNGASAGEKDVVSIEFDIAYGYQYVSNGTAMHQFIIYDKNNTAIVTESYNVNSHSISTSTMGVTTSDVFMPSSSVDTDWGKKVHFAFTFNYETQKIALTTTCSAATNKTQDFEIDMPANTGAISKFFVGSSKIATTRGLLFDNLVIKTTEGDYSTTKNITLAFEDQNANDISGLYTGTTVFTPESGSTFTPSDYYPTAMYDGDYKYTYTSGGDAFTVTDNATVTLVYTKAARPTHAINVTASYGSKTKKIVDNVAVSEATGYTYYYPKFILDGTTLYQYSSSTDPNASASYWTSTLTNVQAAANYTLTYDAVEGECVYFSEAEDIEGATKWPYSDYVGKMSNGNSGVFSAKNFKSLDAGVYTITGSAIGRANDRYIDFYTTSVDDANKILRVVSKNEGNESSATFGLDATTDIIVDGGYAGGSSGHGCDYIYIMKLPATVSATIPSTSQYATISSAYALDCANLPSGLEAYKVSAVSASSATLEQVTTAVAAGTGLILKGTSNESYNIPVVADGTDISGTNKLKAAVTATLLDDESFYILKGGQFHLIKGAATEAARTVPAGKAYLLASDITLAPSLSLVFDSETTGIADVRSKMADVRGDFFDLQGRKVAQPTKGLYIVNGKKAIIK